MPIPFSWVSATPITATSAIPILNPSWNWAKTDGAGIKTYLDDYYSKKTSQYRHELKKAPTLAFESMIYNQLLHFTMSQWIVDGLTGIDEQPQYTTLQLNNFEPRLFRCLVLLPEQV